MLIFLFHKALDILARHDEVAVAVDDRPPRVTALLGRNDLSGLGVAPLDGRIVTVVPPNRDNGLLQDMGSEVKGGNERKG